MKNWVDRTISRQDKFICHLTNLLHNLEGSISTQEEQRRKENELPFELPSPSHSKFIGKIKDLRLGQGIFHVKTLKQLEIRCETKWPKKKFSQVCNSKQWEHNTMYKEIPLKLCMLPTIAKKIDVKL